jgi:hypothetical protein
MAALQLYVASQVKEILSNPSTSREKSRRETLLLALDVARTKRMRLKLFIRLWFVNMQRRDVSLINAIIILQQLPGHIIKIIEQRTHMAVTRGPGLPEPLQMLETPATRDIATIFRHLSTAVIDRQTLREIVMQGTRDSVASIAAVQLILSLLQTLLDIRYHNAQGKQTKALLVTAAKKLNVKDAGKLNMDQLRVSVAYALSQKYAPSPDSSAEVPESS